tara:strand:+ start:304 stop:906 length:603 start_codon:yes stop_codon:yes gene_type:complete
MLRGIYAILILVLISACSSPKNNLEKNLKKLDEVYGYCDNPQRQPQLSKRDYKICKDAERAHKGEDFEFKPETIAEKVLGSLGVDDMSKLGLSSSPINIHLWNGAMKVVEDYPLKNVDSVGGYLETEWITHQNEPDKRCIIKIKLLSTEIISTAVESKIICQKNTNGNWQTTNEDLINESNQITLSVLKFASESSSQSSL